MTGRLGFLSVYLAVLAACVSDRPATGPEQPGTGGTAVNISNFAFAPPSLTVSTGSVVTWTNSDNTGHTVSSEDGTSFDSGVIGQHGTFQFTAGAPGTYSYFCQIHPFMKATLTVTP